MASDEPCEQEHDPQEHDPQEHSPQRFEGPTRPRATASQWWRRVRVGIALAELVAEARGNDALAFAARAVALLGDAVLGTGKS
jgi:hypothetical protein